ncbi:hypothetical protein EYY86_16075 [Hafnia paralvei]|uniref:Uncharacterized protein n=1 Tax=Hafnia alvei TaxID=569 RepID=A0A172WZS7_HAFAL|nr:hypothetical protein [Hafnia paralvei]ANF29869.1 hypothetical protein [Hafnia alvei]TBM12054.1 hypothetical protein EYY86_16075 [Hafnia paralvei]
MIKKQFNKVDESSDFKKNIPRFMKLFTLIALVFISFRIQILSIAFISISLIIGCFYFKQRMTGWLWLFLITCFFILYLIFGLSHYERGGGKFFPRVFVIYLYFLYFYTLAFIDVKYNKLLSYFSILSIFYVYVVCIYSQLHGYQGYNSIHDVINGNDENSPLYAMQLIIFTIVYIHLNWRKGNKGFQLGLLVISTYFSVIYLGSRASFILLFLYVCLQVMNDKKWIIAGIVISFISVAIYIVFLSKLDLMSYLDFGGFQNRGLNSPRFSMLEYGLENFLNYPFGGLVVHGVGYEGTWFHNMLLDIVRVSGYYAMFLWLIILLITGGVLYKIKSTYFTIFVVLNIALMQDLAFDGFFNIMALEFFLLGHIIAYTNKENLKNAN